MKRTNGVLYFVQVEGNGPIKIGITNSPRMRMSTLQGWCPYDLNFICAVRANLMDEAYALEMLAPYQKRGEWFHPHPDVFAFIEEVKAAGKIPNAPAPYPTWRANKTHFQRTTLSRIVPAIWATPEDAARAAGVAKVRKYHSNTIGERTACRLIIEARKLGFNIDTRDLYEDVHVDALQRRAPYRPRSPGAKAPGRKRLHGDLPILEAA